MTGRPYEQKGHKMDENEPSLVERYRLSLAMTEALVNHADCAVVPPGTLEGPEAVTAGVQRMHDRLLDAERALAERNVVHLVDPEAITTYACGIDEPVHRAAIDIGHRLQPGEVWCDECLRVVRVIAAERRVAFPATFSPTWGKSGKWFDWQRTLPAETRCRRLAQALALGENLWNVAHDPWVDAYRRQVERDGTPIAPEIAAVLSAYSLGHPDLREVLDEQESEAVNDALGLAVEADLRERDKAEAEGKVPHWPGAEHVEFMGTHAFGEDELCEVSPTLAAIRAERDADDEIEPDEPEPEEAPEARDDEHPAPAPVLTDRVQRSSDWWRAYQQQAARGNYLEPEVAAVLSAYALGHERLVEVLNQHQGESVTKTLGEQVEDDLLALDDEQQSSALDPVRDAAVAVLDGATSLNPELFAKNLMAVERPALHRLAKAVGWAGVFGVPDTFAASDDSKRLDATEEPAADGPLIERRLRTARAGAAHQLRDAAAAIREAANSVPRADWHLVDPAKLSEMSCVLEGWSTTIWDRRSVTVEQLEREQQFAEANVAYAKLAESEPVEGALRHYTARRRGCSCRRQVVGRSIADARTQAAQLFGVDESDIILRWWEHGSYHESHYAAGPTEPTDDSATDRERLLATGPALRALLDVSTERRRLLEHTPSDDGLTDLERHALLSLALREVAGNRLRRSGITHDDGPSDDTALRQELCQLAALAVAWMERL